MGAFCRFYDKTFATLCATIKNKSIIKALSQPFLFCNTLPAGHGAADMFLVNIFFCDPNIFHPLFLQCSQFYFPFSHECGFYRAPLFFHFCFGKSNSSYIASNSFIKNVLLSTSSTNSISFAGKVTSNYSTPSGSSA